MKNLEEYLNENIEVENIELYMNKLNIDDKMLLFKINEYKKIAFSENIILKEELLRDIWNHFRVTWIEVINNKTKMVYKSPEISNNNNGLKPLAINYSYERNIQSDFLEMKARNLRSSIENWRDEHIIFSSGMSALTNLILNFKSMI
ncbi:TPA: hypothetical protein ACOTG1_003352, partial [Clostridium perfringens]